MVSMAFLSVALLIVFQPSWAVIYPHSLYGDNMVLQQKQETVIFGIAAPFENITLKGTPSPHSEYKTVADIDGKWMIRMMPYRFIQQKEKIGSTNSFTLQLKGSKDPVVHVAKNVSYGEVLLCSGQSNMALNINPIYNNETIIKTANHPEIRLFHVPTIGRDTPATNVSASWKQTTPISIPSFSAICYLTALKLQELHGNSSMLVFGLIESAVGSTDVQSWMSPEAREEARLGCWSPSGQPPPDHLPKSHSHSPHNATNATFLWNGMIAPLIPFSIGSILWDQGENNAAYCTTRQYNCLFSTMIFSWRKAWGRTPDILPVAFVQLGGYSGKNLVSKIRFAQSDTLPSASNWFTNHSQSSIPSNNTAMAPTYDLGSPCPTCPNGTWWIHCRNKTEVSRRLALQLNHLWNTKSSEMSNTTAESTNIDVTYNENDIEFSGPIVSKIVLIFDDKKPRVQVFMNHSNGLVLAPSQGCVQCCDTIEPSFEVANRKGEWLSAVGFVSEAVGPSNVIVRPISNVTGAWISAVRFAVQDIPQCTLYNSAQLPAVPFSLPVPWNYNN